MNNKKVFNILIKILKVVIPIILLTWLLSLVDWQEALSLISNIPWYTIVGSLCFFLLAELVIVVRWFYLLHVKNIHISLRKIMKYVFISLFGSNFMPSTIGGDVIKIAGVSRETKENKGLAIASVVADRLYNMVGMVFMLPFSIFVIGKEGYAHFRQNNIENLAFSLFGMTSQFKWIFAKFKEIWASANGWFTSPMYFFPFLLLSIISGI